MGAQNLSFRGDLESFRDGFAGFAARNGFRHKARKIVQFAFVTTDLANNCPNKNLRRTFSPSR